MPNLIWFATFGITWYYWSWGWALILATVLMTAYAAYTKELFEEDDGPSLSEIWSEIGPGNRSSSNDTKSEAIVVIKEKVDKSVKIYPGNW